MGCSCVDFWRLLWKMLQSMWFLLPFLQALELILIYYWLRETFFEKHIRTIHSKGAVGRRRSRSFLFGHLAHRPPSVKTLTGATDRQIGLAWRIGRRGVCVGILGLRIHSIGAGPPSKQSDGLDGTFVRHHFGLHNKIPSDLYFLLSGVPSLMETVSLLLPYRNRSR